MFDVREPHVASLRLRPAIVGAVVCGALSAGGVAGAAAATPAAAPGFTVAKIADAPARATNCDDLALLEGHLFMTCQNATLSGGGGGSSTIGEYGENGALVRTWSLPDKADGIGADPLNHRVIVTLDEDHHSHLATITPSAPAAAQVTNYAYSPGAPDTAAAKGALHTGGGTDSVSVDRAGHVYITASHPQGHTGTAVFRVVLTPPAAGAASGTAALTPTWLDNATAANGNAGTGTVKLALGDVDSGAIVPATSPRYGGSFVIDDQTSQQLVFARDINAATGLTALKTPFGLDDIRWVTSDGGILFVVDKGAPAAAGRSALYKVTGPFVTGTALASNDGLGDQVVKVNLTTGALTPVVQHLITTKGLVYAGADGTEAPLALAGSGPAPAAASGSSDTLPIVLGAIAVALGAAGGLALARRRRRTG